MKVKIYQCYSRNTFPWNIGALGIKFFSKTDYSHYAMSYISETSKMVFIDSTMHGVRSMSKERFLKHYDIKKIYRCTEEISRLEFLIWFEKHQGKGYGFYQIIGLLGKILHIIKNNPLGKGTKRIICNELIIMFLNRFYATNISDTDSLDLNDTEHLLEGTNL